MKKRNNLGQFAEGWSIRTALERFEEKFIPEPNTGCWIWMGSTVKSWKALYGTFWLNGNHLTAHRAAFIIYKGGIADDLEPDHLCRFTLCVNPQHLEAVSHRINTLRGNGATAVHARKTHCKNGHPFTSDNLYASPSCERKRICKECTRARLNRANQRRREARLPRERVEAVIRDWMIGMEAK